MCKAKFLKLIGTNDKNLFKQIEGNIHKNTVAPTDSVKLLQTSDAIITILTVNKYMKYCINMDIAQKTG